MLFFSLQRKRIVFILVAFILFLVGVVFVAFHFLKKPKSSKDGSGVPKQPSTKIGGVDKARIVGVDREGIILPDKLCGNILGEKKKQQCFDKWTRVRAVRQTHNVKECVSIKDLSKRWDCISRIALFTQRARFCEKILDEEQKEKCLQDVGISTRNEKYCQTFNNKPNEKQECLDRTKAFKYGDKKEVNKCKEIKTLEYSMLCVMNSLGFGAGISDCDRIGDQYLHDRCVSMLLLTPPLTKEKCRAMPIEDYKKVCLLLIKNGGRRSDSDRDGISDGLELWIQTRPFSSDTDSDGLTDGEEYFTYHTNPASSDTDSDGLSDYDEVKKYKTDPDNPDTDGDGYLDGEEVKKGYNPTSGDTDKDGLSDVDERKFGTDINNPDTDGDGMSDFEEVERGFDPLKKGKVLADTDKDGLLDIDEVFYGTDRFRKDTDGDGIDDKKEVDNLTNPLGQGDMDFDGDGLSDKVEKKYKTNPTLSDTDGDSLSDKEEIEKYKTNPLEKDTDGDGYLDGEEVRKGYDPLDRKG